MIRPPGTDPEAAGDDYLDPDAIADAYWTLVGRTARRGRQSWTFGPTSRSSEPPTRFPSEAVSGCPYPLDAGRPSRRGLSTGSGGR